jgi:hypothetical protein
MIRMIGMNEFLTNPKLYICMLPFLQVAIKELGLGFRINLIYLASPLIPKPPFPLVES